MSTVIPVDVNKTPTDLGEACIIIGALRYEVDSEKKYRLLLGVRSRIERLELIFRGKELLGGKKCSREETWLAIFDRGKHRMLNHLKSLISDSGLAIEEFCQGIGIIYGDFSDRAAHGVSLPREIQHQNIENVVELLAVDNNEQIEKTLLILTSRLKLIDSLPMKKDASCSDDSLVSFDRSPPK